MWRRWSQVNLAGSARSPPEPCSPHARGRGRAGESVSFVPSGIYRAVPIRANPRVSNVKSVYKTHIDVIHYRKTDSKRLHGLDEEAEQKLFSEKRVELLKELSRKPDIYERLASALAPSIYEHEDIKKVTG